MSHRMIGEQPQPALAVLVESVAGPLLMAHPAPVCLEMEVDTNLRSAVDSPSLTTLIESLVRQSLDEMPKGGDLTITACDTGSHLELEIADSGSDVSERACSLPMVAAAMGVEISWQNCPQGGAAATIKLPGSQQALRRAA
ncbi:MAG: ATPase [Planctomycetota bacterium]